jgi:CRP/FNR family transcriptional regulator, cyclic AMP receptor protein
VHRNRYAVLLATLQGGARVTRDDAALLQQTPLFGTMALDALDRLADKAVRRSYGRGEVIFHEDDTGDSLCVVVGGLVKVYRTSPDGDEMVLVTLGPSSVFGELPMVDGGLRSASAAAVDATTVLTLSRAALLDALRVSPELADRLLRSLGSMIRRLTDQAADLVFLDLHGRVAKLLLALSEERGTGDAHGLALDLHLTQTDLANMVGGSRQSVNQVLRSFERLGYLELDGRRVVIRRPDLLLRRAGQSDELDR